MVVVAQARSPHGVPDRVDEWRLFNPGKTPYSPHHGSSLFAFAMAVDTETAHAPLPNLGEPVTFEGAHAEDFVREMFAPPTEGHDERIDGALASFAATYTDRAANDFF
jgi:hypothetical protein